MTAKELLRECNPFSRLAEADLDKIAGLAVEKRFEAGTTIFQGGSDADELFVLREGRVALQMALPKVNGQNGRRITVDVVSKKEVLGWSGVVEPYKYTFTAVCLQETKAISISSNKLRDLLRESPDTGYEVLHGLIGVVASRLYDTMHVLVSERLLVPALNER